VASCKSPDSSNAIFRVRVVNWSSVFAPSYGGDDIQQPERKETQTEVEFIEELSTPNSQNASGTLNSSSIGSGSSLHFYIYKHHHTTTSIRMQNFTVTVTLGTVTK
jgi:hypothetical protein